MEYKSIAGECCLHAPQAFWSADKDTLDSYGCGPGEVGDKFVPDTMWGLNIKVCCVIHDIDWALAETEDDFIRANERFLINLLRVINKKSNFILKGLRRYRATSYYSAVEDVGLKYWKKKKANPTN